MPSAALYVSQSIDDFVTLCTEASQGTQSNAGREVATTRGKHKAFSSRGRSSSCGIQCGFSAKPLILPTLSSSSHGHRVSSGIDLLFNEKLELSCRKFESETTTAVKDDLEVGNSGARRPPASRTAFKARRPPPTPTYIPKNTQGNFFKSQVMLCTSLQKLTVEIDLGPSIAASTLSSPPFFFAAAAAACSADPAVTVRLTLPRRQWHNSSTADNNLGIDHFAQGAVSALHEPTPILRVVYFWFPRRFQSRLYVVLRFTSKHCRSRKLPRTNVGALLL